MTDYPFLHAVVLEPIEPEPRSLWQPLARAVAVFGSFAALFALSLLLG
ncbi:MAG: hypothetical protein JO247_13925 [Chloroflexi bacterium]|nr:hypothetical protein [Chloroflexota bacterium]